MKYEDGKPCKHVGCERHISHPCEGCGRIGARNNTINERTLKLELPLLNMENFTLEQQDFKVIEEFIEYENSNNREEAISEALDMIQVLFGLIEKITTPEDRIKLFERHFLKLKQHEAKGKNGDKKREGIEIIGKIKIEIVKDVE